MTAAGIREHDTTALLAAQKRCARCRRWRVWTYYSPSRQSAEQPCKPCAKAATCASRRKNGMRERGPNRVAVQA